MASDARKNAWAASEDWEVHKETISHLYIDEGKPLREVMAIMSEKHGFRPTAKMYKHRIQAWGLRKNLKAAEADKLMDWAQNGLISESLAVRGRQLGAKRWRHRLGKAASASGVTPTAANSSKCEAPQFPYLPSQMTEPDMQRQAEYCLHAVQEYVLSQFVTGAWDLSGLVYDNGQDKIFDWSTRLSLTIGHLVKEPNSQHDFAKLHFFFDAFGSVTDDLTPGLVPWTMYNLVHFLQIGPEIADIFIRFASGLFVIKLGRTHALTRFWMQLRALGAVQVHHTMAAIMKVYYDIMASHSHPANAWHVQIFPTFSRLMFQIDGLPSSSVTEFYETTIRGVENRVTKDADAVALGTPYSNKLRDSLQMVKINFGTFLIHRRSFLEAHQFIESMETWFDSGTSGNLPAFYELWLRDKGRALSGLGRLREATPFFLQCYRSRRKRCGLRDPHTRLLLIDLEENYTRLREHDEAERIAAEFAASWDYLDDPERTLRIRRREWI
ncbi:Clr5 domain-containing protein [Xylariales sp. PMI_506]|nr:Clr5 domain-containing protein [Xylariales sp. PMI_506]